VFWREHTKKTIQREEKEVATLPMSAEATASEGFFVMLKNITIIGYQRFNQN
jgi:hypothetical protein